LYVGKNDPASLTKLEVLNKADTVNPVFYFVNMCAEDMQHPAGLVFHLLHKKD
jgi:hypothetical protein